jgi:hypothetical protein
MANNINGYELVPGADLHGAKQENQKEINQKIKKVEEENK